MKKIYDVIVVGAGASGMNAALSAARNGMSVLLIDKNGYPGGTNTAAMVGPLMTFHAGKNQIVKGIAQEIIDRLSARNGTLGHLPDPIGMASSVTPVDPEILKLVYFEMLAEESNITTLLYTNLAAAEIEEDCITSITVLNKSGMTTCRGRVFIDASGDGDLCAMSNVDYVIGRKRDSLSQPMSLMFSLSNVNLEKTTEYILANPEQFIMNRECDLKKYLAVSGFFDCVARAKENGDFPLSRDRVLFFQGMYADEVVINMTRVTKHSGIDAGELTQAEFAAHQQVDIVVCFLRKYIPGFEHARLHAVASSTGVRESRHIVGMDMLTSDMVINSESNQNSVAVCAFPIDIHDPNGSELNWIRKEKVCCYDIPYGVMVPKNISNLLATGRCISASHEAIASARVTPTAMALGQAAGVAASLAVSEGIPCHAISVDKLQTLLAEQGAVPGKCWIMG